MAVRLRVVAAVLTAACLVIVSSTLLTYGLGSYILGAHEREQVRRQDILLLEQLLSTLKDAETGQRGFIITGDERYLEPYHRAVRELPNQLGRFDAEPRIDISGADVRAIAQLVGTKLDELGKTIELRRTAGFQAAAAVVQGGEGKGTMDQLRAEIGRLQNIKTAALESEQRRSDGLTKLRTFVFAASTLLSVVVLAWAYRRIAESMRTRDEALFRAEKRGAELAQQKELLAVTLASIGDCIIVTDIDGRIDFMNKVAEQVTGWRLTEASHRPIGEVFKIINEETRASVESPVSKVMREGVIVGLANHTLLIRKDGTELPIDDSGAPIHDGTGKLRGAVLVFRDFSQQRLQERELQKAKETAETANEAKDQFLAMLSHELRTPLTPVLAMLNIWEASDEVPETMRSDVEMLRRSIELEARIIDDLLDITRIAKGMLSLSPEPTDLHSLIEILVELCRSEIDAKQLDVRLSLQADRHIVHSDAGRLQQVLWNVLRNAVKFTEEGSVTITTTNNGNDVEISITDTGIGMAPATLERLFVPFEQGNRGGQYGGLGLGMAISHALVEGLHGKLTAVSPGLGKGSTFTIIFPTVDAVPDGSVAEPLIRQDIGKPSLLLIEDHADTAQALVKLLRLRGYTVETAPSIAAALRAAGQKQFDLYLCDISLSDGTGFDFLNKLGRTRAVPAIALTGFGMDQDVRRAEMAGFAAHLTKPIDFHKLEAAIWKAIGTAHQPSDRGTIQKS